METHILILQVLLNGIILGSMYTLMAQGLALLYGVMDVLNWAIGDLGMIGAYVCFFIFSAGIDLKSSFLMAIGISIIMAIVIGRIIIQPLQKFEQEKMGMLSTVVTFGLSICLQNFALVVFGSEYRSLPAFFGGKSTFFGLALSNQRIANFFIVILITLGLWLFLNKTTLGTAIQAVAQNRIAAAKLGINTANIYLLTFCIGTVLAVIAGILLSSIFLIYPLVGSTLLLPIFAVIVLGGLGSVKGSIFGGFIIGIAESLGIFLLSTSWKDLFSFVSIMLILIFKPKGLFGIREK